MSNLPVLHGASVSPNVRTARITLAEAGLPFTYEDIGFDVLATDAYAAINPFRKMPALVVAGTPVYETAAIMAYADAAGRPLLPADPLARAKAWQFVGIAQHHLYPVGVMQLTFHALLAAKFGLTPDPAVAAAAEAPTRMHLDVLAAALVGPFLAGDALSVADIHCGAMVDYVARTEAGGRAVAERPAVATWLEGLRGRPSFTGTLSPIVGGAA